MPHANEEANKNRPAPNGAERLNHDVWVGGVIEPRGPPCGCSSARGLRHHAQINDRLIVRGSILTIAGSFSDRGNISA